MKNVIVLSQAEQDILDERLKEVDEGKVVSSDWFFKLKD